MGRKKRESADDQGTPEVQAVGTPGRGLSIDPPALEPEPEPIPEPIPSGYSTDPDVPSDAPIAAAPMTADEKLALKQTEDLAGLPHAKD